MLCYLKQERLSHTLPSWGVPLYSDRCLRFSLEMADLNSSQEKLAKCLYTFQTNIAHNAFIESVYVAIPFILIILCYVKVFYTVPSTNRIFSAKNNLHTLRANTEEARVTKTLGTVMVGFAFCWLPVCTIDYVDAAYRVPTLPWQVYPIYGFLIYLSSTINPFMYGATNGHFRRESKVILRKVFCQKLS